VSRSFAIAICAAGLVLVCRAKADALTELCPAGIYWAPTLPATVDGRAGGIAYQLVADGPRTIASATIVADTDGGWYSWDVADIPLAVGTAKTRAESALLAVDFPKVVFVRHAWLINAKTSGDTLFGWDALGKVACGLPTFPSSANRAEKPRDSTGLRHVAATPIAPLFTSDCAHPFVSAQVTHPVRPDYPRGAPPMEYASQIEVLVGDHDNLISAWIYRSSGNHLIDANALAAALASSYKSGTSYCQKANGYYNFRADFQP
jgi:hypothetical protein